MVLIKAIIIAFSTYTRIPMPHVKWDDAAMKLAIVFLPLVGVIVAFAVWGWIAVCRWLGISAVMFAAAAVVLPIIITGGIHMDGFCDTTDALESRTDKERRLEILKDPNAGAFAVIRSGAYLLLTFGLLHELYEMDADIAVGFAYVLSRCFAAISAVMMPKAKNDGMLAAFTKSRSTAGIIMCAFALVTIIVMILSSVMHGAIALLLCLPVTVWYEKMAVGKFGGATGDTTGYYLQLIELTMFIGFFVGGVILSWI